MTDRRGLPIWERALAPRALLLGCALSFLACCVAGRVVSHINIYQDFRRFHEFISYRTLFYPTASQTRALGRENLAPEQVAVVVGGSSVLFGYGQGPEHLWTRQLQALLGDHYRVLNFAQTGDWPGGFGAVAAEMLEREHPKTIFVTDVVAGTASVAGEPDGEKHQYFFWDAQYKGLLSPNPVREARLAELAAWARKNDAAYAELKRGARLDSWLYYQDLWTAFGYRCASTVWCDRVAGSVTRPRVRYQDPDPVIPFGQRYSAATDQAVLSHFHWDLSRHWPGTPAPGPGADYSTTPLVQSFQFCFSPSARRRTLVVIDRVNPHYLARLPADARARYEADFPETVQALQQAGFDTLELGRGYTELDYTDVLHVSAEGAGKMAADVAPAVRRLARALGYAD